MRQFGTIIPADLLFRTVVLLLIWLGFAVWSFISPPSEAVARDLGGSYWYVGAFLVLATLFDLYLRKGYQVSYDETAIYWQKVGFRGRFAKTVEMPFSAITHVDTLAGTLNVKPFEVAVLHAGANDIPDILLSRLYLTKWDMKELLSEVAARSEAAFDQQIREFVEAPDLTPSFQP